MIFNIDKKYKNDYYVFGLLKAHQTLHKEKRNVENYPRTFRVKKNDL